jgi:hypothetical protein
MADIDLRPTQQMADNAARGLELRKKHGRGGTAVGVARARDISNRKNLSASTVKRMHSFFSRHEGNQAGGEDDAGYIAWLLWGGDAGKSWSKRKVEQIDGKSESMKSNNNRPIGTRLINGTHLTEKIGPFEVYWHGGSGMQSYLTIKKGNLSFPVSGSGQIDREIAARGGFVPLAAKRFGEAWEEIAPLVGANATPKRAAIVIADAIESFEEEGDMPAMVTQLKRMLSWTKSLNTRPGTKAKFTLSDVILDAMDALKHNEPDAASWVNDATESITQYRNEMTSDDRDWMLYQRLIALAKRKGLQISKPMTLRSSRPGAKAKFVTGKFTLVVIDLPGKPHFDFNTLREARDYHDKHFGTMRGEIIGPEHAVVAEKGYGDRWSVFHSRPGAKVRLGRAERQLPNGEVHLDFSAAKEWLSALPPEQLRYIMKDAREAANAMPDGKKFNYYQDLALTAGDILRKRMKASRPGAKAQMGEYSSRVKEALQALRRGDIKDAAQQAEDLRPLMTSNRVTTLEKLDYAELLKELRSHGVRIWSRSGAKKKNDLTEACWEGYEAVGTKKKDGKTVPNCVPKKAKP